MYCEVNASGTRSGLLKKQKFHCPLRDKKRLLVSRAKVRAWACES